MIETGLGFPPSRSIPLRFLQIDRTRPQALTSGVVIQVSHQNLSATHAYMYLGPAALDGYLAAVRMESKFVPDPAAWHAKRLRRG